MSMSRHTCRNSIKATTISVRPIQRNQAKCCGLTLVAVATKFGLGAEIPDAYRLAECLLVDLSVNYDH